MFLKLIGRKMFENYVSKSSVKRKHAPQAKIFLLQSACYKKPKERRKFDFWWKIEIFVKIFS